MYVHIKRKLNHKYVKVKKVLNRKDKNTGKEFFRWDITIDPEFIRELGWKKGTELDGKVTGGKLILKEAEKK